MKARQSQISALRRRIDSSGEATTLFDLLRAKEARACCRKVAAESTGSRAPMAYKPARRHRAPAFGYRMCDNGVFALPDADLITEVYKLQEQNEELVQQIEALAYQGNRLHGKPGSAAEREQATPEQVLRPQVSAAQKQLEDLQNEIIRVRAQLSGLSRPKYLSQGCQLEMAKRVSSQQTGDDYDARLLEAHQNLQYVADALALAVRLQSPERAVGALLQVQKRENNLQEEDAGRELQELQARVYEQHRRRALQTAALDNLQQQIALNAEIVKRVRGFNCRALDGVAAFYDAYQLLALLEGKV